MAAQATLSGIIEVSGDLSTLKDELSNILEAASSETLSGIGALQDALAEFQRVVSGATSIAWDEIEEQLPPEVQDLLSQVDGLYEAIEAYAREIGEKALLEEWEEKIETALQEVVKLIESPRTELLTFLNAAGDFAAQMKFLVKYLAGDLQEEINRLPERVLDELSAEFNLVFGQEILGNLEKKVSAFDAGTKEDLVNALEAFESEFHRWHTGLLAASNQLKRWTDQDSVNELLQEVQNELESVLTWEIESRLLGHWLLGIDAKAVNALYVELLDELWRIQRSPKAIQKQMPNLPDVGTVTLNVEGLSNVKDFLVTRLTELEGVVSEVNVALSAVNANVQKLAEAFSRLPTDVCKELEDLEAGADDALAEFESVLDQGRRLTFRPVTDLVIQEINAITARLRAIDINALPDLERVALKSGLYVLEENDLFGRVRNGISTLYEAPKKELSEKIGEVKDALDEIHQFLYSLGQKRNEVRHSLDRLDEVLSSLLGNEAGKPWLQKLTDSFDEGRESYIRALVNFQARYDHWARETTRLDKVHGFLCDSDWNLDPFSELVNDLFSDADRKLLSDLQNNGKMEPQQAAKAIGILLFGALLGDAQISTQDPSQAVTNWFALLKDKVESAISKADGMELPNWAEALRTAAKKLQQPPHLDADAIRNHIVTRYQDLLTDAKGSLEKIDGIQTTFKTRIKEEASMQADDFLDIRIRFEATLQASASIKPDELLPVNDKDFTASIYAIQMDEAIANFNAILSNLYAMLKNTIPAFPVAGEVTKDAQTILHTWLDNISAIVQQVLAKWKEPDEGQLYSSRRSIGMAIKSIGETLTAIGKDVCKSLQNLQTLVDTIQVSLNPAEIIAGLQAYWDSLNKLENAIDNGLGAIGRKLQEIRTTLHDAMQCIDGLIDWQQGKLFTGATQFVGTLQEQMELVNQDFTNELSRVEVAFKEMIAAIPTARGEAPVAA